MIRIRELSNGHYMIVSSVSEFCDSMGYCEMRIKHFLEGRKPPQTKITIEGTKAHEEEEEYEKEHFKFVACMHFWMLCNEATKTTLTILVQ